MKKTILCCATALLCVAMLSYPLYKTSGELRNFSSAISYFSEAVSSDMTPIYQGIIDVIEKTNVDTKYHLETIPAGENSFFIVDLDTGNIYSVTKGHDFNNTLIKVEVRSSYKVPGSEVVGKFNILDP